MQHMPQNTMTIHKSAHMLGSLVDDILGKNSDMKISDEDLKALGDLNKYVEIASGMYKAVNTQLLTALLVSTPAGYGAAKIFDTNTDPSNLKTMGTMLAGSIATGAVSRLVSAFTGVDLPEDNTSNASTVANAALLIEAIQSDTVGALKHLQDREIIEAAKYEELTKVIADAKSASSTIARVLTALFAIESLATAYHGYRRNNDSIGYGLAWWLTSGVGLGVALGQGYAKPLNK